MGDEIIASGWTVGGDALELGSDEPLSSIAEWLLYMNGEYIKYIELGNKRSHIEIIGGKDTEQGRKVLLTLTPDIHSPNVWYRPINSQEIKDWKMMESVHLTEYPWENVIPICDAISIEEAIIAIYEFIQTHKLSDRLNWRNSSGTFMTQLKDYVF